MPVSNQHCINLVRINVYPAQLSQRTDARINHDFGITAFN